MDAIQVLVLDSVPRVHFCIQNLSQDEVDKYNFIHTSLSNFSNLQEFLESVREIVRQKDVEIVLPTTDSGALVKAALVQEFPHLRGPSVESVFLANNKYYTRCFLDPQPIPFASLDLTAPNLDQACEEALEKVGTPAFFKPTNCWGSKGVYSIETSQQLKDSAQSYVGGSDFVRFSDANFTNLFYSNYIDERKYPLVNKQSAIIEKHMGNIITTNSDSYVLDGEIHHWSISDNLYSKIKPRYYLGAFCPTRLPETAQQKIWDLHDAVLRRMIDFGFDNDFVNVETFLLDSGEVKLMEVNPRPGGNLTISANVFEDGNIIGAQLKLAQGENPGPPVPNGLSALHGYVRTCGSGKAKEFYDFSHTSTSLVPTTGPEDFVCGSGESGALLGHALLSGNGYEEVMKKYWSTCRSVLKPESSVWK